MLFPYVFAKNVVVKITNENKISEFCIDRRENVPDIAENFGITTINYSVYNELKQLNMSDKEIADTLKQVSIMEQQTEKTSNKNIYSVSKSKPLFLEYEIKDDASYNNFINEVLSENLGFGYVINIESLDDNLKNELKKAKQNGIVVYVKSSDDIKQEQIKELEQFMFGYIDKKDNTYNFDKSSNDISFTRICDFKGIDDLENKIKSSQNTPLIYANELSTLINKERFTDKFIILNKLAKLLFVKREYNKDYIKDLANNADEKLLKEISNQIEQNGKFDNDILKIILQNPTVKIIFKKIEINNSNKTETELKDIKDIFIKTIAVRALLYSFSNGKNIKQEYIKNITNIGVLFDKLIEAESNINIKEKHINLTSTDEENIDNIKQQINSGNLSIEDMIMIENKKINAITKMEYILNFLTDDKLEMNKKENEFNSIMEVKALLSAA